MNEQSAPRVYGLRMGMVAAVYSVAQALLLYASALGAYAAVRSVQQGINIVNNVQQPVVDFTLLAPGLIPMLLVAYGSMIVAGLVTLRLAWAAGRLAAVRAGARKGGARAGMWVWLVSSLVWIAASVIVVALGHMDGTVTGILAGTGRPEFTGAEILGLVTQEVIFALIGLGLCAMTGNMGARGAELVDPEPVALPAGAAVYPFAMVPAPWGGMPPAGYQPGPPMGYPPAPGPWMQAAPGAFPPPPGQAGPTGYPGAMFPPPLPWSPPAGVYPPPPSHYLPQQPAPTPAQQYPTTPAAPPSAEGESRSLC